MAPVKNVPVPGAQTYKPAPKESVKPAKPVISEEEKHAQLTKKRVIFIIHRVDPI